MTETDDPLAATADAAWVLQAHGFDKLREGSVESRFAISNGFLGVRAALAVHRGARWVVPPRTYVAGLFDTAPAAGAIPELVAAADWLSARVLVGGEPAVHHPGAVAARRMTLDLRRGAVLTEGRLSPAPGLGIRVRTLRLVSLHERALGLQLIRLEIEQGEAELTLEAWCDGVDLGLVADRIDHDVGVWHTPHSNKGLAMACAAALRIDGAEAPPGAGGPLRWSWTWTSRPGQVVWFERVVALARSDAPGEQPECAAQGKLGIARRLGWRSVLAEHETAWAGRWQCSDVVVEGDAAAQQALRFAAYHLNGAADPADARVSIGARALTGADYHGHVFWDTEIFLLPFYVLTWPDAARTLLMYRFRTLDAARAKAARMGWRGALYAWESADGGEEATPDHVVAPDRRVVAVLGGTQEQHISADIAYAVWQYWQATEDHSFLLDAGAEILLETGRFWASRAQPEADGFCHIRGVIGPDEYHETIDDNAFTNVMARWNIRCALAVAALLRARWPGQWGTLAARLGLDDAELARWRVVADTIATGFAAATGLFEQFSGYFALEDIDLAQYAGRSVPMDIVLGRERTARSQVVKQADVVALLALLPEAFPGAAAARNNDYYEPRCSHGSSLSHVMHALVAARLGRPDAALLHFRQAAAIDLGDGHVGIDGGVHIATQGGIWQAAVLGFAGLSLRDDGVAIDPHLPSAWRSIGFQLNWRGRCVNVMIDNSGERVAATLAAGEPMTVVVRGVAHELTRQRAIRVAATARASDAGELA